MTQFHVYPQVLENNAQIHCRYLLADPILKAQVIEMVDQCDVGDYGGYGLIGEANQKTIEKCLEDQGLDLGSESGVWSVYGPHSYSSLCYDPAKISNEIRELIDSLEDYPLLDDNLYSQLQVEREGELWEQQSLDIVEEIREWIVNEEIVAECPDFSIDFNVFCDLGVNVELCDYDSYLNFEESELVEKIKEIILESGLNECSFINTQA